MLFSHKWLTCKLSDAHCISCPRRAEVCLPYPVGTREPGRALEEGSGLTLGSWHFFVGNAYRECLENGTWASKINYSQCEPILDDKVSGPHLL